jgi:glycerol-3-phosphate O-acyltransferase
MDYFQKLEKLKSLNKTSLEISEILHQFYFSYKQAIESNGLSIKKLDPLLIQFLDFVEDQLKHPFQFEPFHQCIRKPVDYYQFGLEFIKPLVMLNESKVVNLEVVDEIQKHLLNGENVILLANHQTEPDPQAISILLEKNHPKLAEEMIFVAGHRVTSDPLCIPFSMGRNLLCIYSKKYIQTPPEKTIEKQQHNQRTMMRMKELLSEGGKCIYVAPSGGRDRLNDQGVIDVAKFDPQSIEMFLLMAKQSGKPTHFYPLSLSTYHLLPPPESVDKELGEKRHATCTPIHLCFNEEIDMDHFPGHVGLDKRQKRQVRADYIWNIVKNDYDMLEKY